MYSHILPSGCALIQLYLHISGVDYVGVLSLPDCAYHTIPQSTNHTHGSATPLPYILYSALSEYGSFSHFATCLSDFILQPVTSE